MRKQAQYYSRSAPIGGLNFRDPLSNMSPTDAVILENLFPDEAGVSSRFGSNDYALSLPSSVDSLMTYSDGQTEKLFAASGTGIYDVSASGDVGASVKSVLNDRFSWVETENSAGNRYLVCVNGADVPIIYDGSTWADSTFSGTGLTVNDLVYVTAFKNRLYFIEKNTFNLWYSDIFAISGTLNKVPLTSIVTRGSRFVGMTTISLDSSAGIDEYICLFTDSGQVIMYQGDDPSDAARWKMVSRFEIGSPVGERFYTRIRGDAALLTSDGIFMLSQALNTDRSQLNISVSDKINPEITNQVQKNGALFGWQILFHPDNEKLYVNIPTSENVSSFQYVMNTRTGAWTKFTGWTCNVMTIYKDVVHSGRNTKTVELDVGKSDNGSPITLKALEAFSDLGRRDKVKSFSMIRPIIKSELPVNPSVAINVNYQIKEPTTVISYSQTDVAIWDVSQWDVGRWGGINKEYSQWKGVTGRGFSGALYMRLQVSGLSLEWQGTDYQYQAGGLI